MIKRMSHKSLPLFLILLLSLAALPFNAPAQDGKSFLWRVRTGTATVYLLGSVHFMKEDAYPLGSVIENAFAVSGTLAVEADINNIGKTTLERLGETGFYHGDDSIARHISPETYAYVKQEAARLGFPIASIDRQRPWLLGMMMSSMELMKAGYNPHYGIDKYFLTRAAGKKKILELESIDYQINLLAGLPDDEQESFLIYAIKDLQTLIAQMDMVMEAWRSGNAGRISSIMERSIAGDERLQAIHKKIMTDRNRNITQKIVSYLGSRETVFVVVGAGHLVGDKGIVELLRKQGYTVEQL